MVGGSSGGGMPSVVIDAAKKLPEKARQMVEREVSKITNRMSDKARNELESNLHEVKFPRSETEMRDQYQKMFTGVPGAELTKDDDTPAGAYGWNEKSGSMMALLPLHERNAEGTWSHEITHAIDGPHQTYSNTPEWKAAWKAEIKGGSLSAYAASNPGEGFAELGRYVYSDYNLEVVKNEWPKSYAFLKKRGLL